MRGSTEVKLELFLFRSVFSLISTSYEVVLVTEHILSSSRSSLIAWGKLLPSDADSCQVL